MTARTFGNEDQDILDSFMDDLGDWEETFLSLSNSLAVPGTNMRPLLEEVFRGVHSLKGGAAFVSAIDPRMEALTKYCHTFETYLHALRYGKAPHGESARELTCEGLVFLADGAKALREGDDFPAPSGILDRLSAAPNNVGGPAPDTAADTRKIGDMAEVAGNENGLLHIRLLRNIRYAGESQDFGLALSNLASSASPGARIVYDFGDQWRISSMVVGQIIASLPNFAEVAVIHGMHNELTWRRFRLREMGVRVCPDMSAYQSARGIETSYAR